MRRLALAALLTGGCTSLLGIGEPAAGGGDAGGDGPDGAPPIDAPGLIDAIQPPDAMPPEDLFEAKISIATGTFTRAVAIADVDEDTFADIVAVNRGSNDVSVIRGLGNRMFAGKVDFAMGNQPESIVIADVNGDGHLDLVVGSTGDQTIVVRLNNPAALGSFLAPTSKSAGDTPLALVATDLVGSPHPDLLMCGDSSARLFVNDGAGGFTLHAQFASLSYGRCDIGVIDLDGDAFPDIATVAHPGVHLVRQDPADPGTFLTPTTLAAGDGMMVQSLAVADMNSDGRPDIVTGGRQNNMEPPTSVIFLQDQATPGLFLPPIELAEGKFEMPEFAAVALAPLGGGSLPDIAFVDEVTDRLVVFLDLTAAPASGQALDETTGDGPRGLAVGQLDGDGLFDAVSADNLAGGVSVFFHR